MSITPELYILSLSLLPEVSRSFQVRGERRGDAQRSLRGREAVGDGCCQAAGLSAKGKREEERQWESSSSLLLLREACSPSLPAQAVGLCAVLTS